MIIRSARHIEVSVKLKFALASVSLPPQPVSVQLHGGHFAATSLRDASLQSTLLIPNGLPTLTMYP